MPASDLSRVALEAMRLQNGYALAIDARDWELFRTVFTPDVRADYPHGVFNGMEDWLGNFIPFHDTSPSPTPGNLAAQLGGDELGCLGGTGKLTCSAARHPRIHITHRT